jgi:hypothetical protein
MNKFDQIFLIFSHAKMLIFWGFLEALDEAKLSPLRCFLLAVLKQQHKTSN